MASCALFGHRNMDMAQYRDKLLYIITDLIVAGVMTHGGGSYAALKYAYKRKKPIISIIEGWKII